MPKKNIKLQDPKYKEYLNNKYNVLGWSFHKIGAELDKPPAQIRRDLIYFGYKPRSKSDAQKMSLAMGHTTHPTKGRKRSDEEKAHIGEKVANYWQNADESTKKAKSEQSKKQWKEMSLEKRDKIQAASAKAILRASKEGSKLERFLITALTDAGHKVVHHQEFMFPSEKMHIDIFLPDIGVCLEVDGPTHSQPIWGEDKLAKKIETDDMKNGLVLSKGLHMLRLKHVVGRVTPKYEEKVLKVVLPALEKLKSAAKPTLLKIEP